MCCKYILKNNVKSKRLSRFIAKAIKSIRSLLFLILTLHFSLLAVISNAEDHTAATLKNALTLVEQENYIAAIEILEVLSENQNAAAINELAKLYDDGKGVELDDGKAFNLYLRAHDLGNAKATYNLGLMYEWGEGVSQDYSMAHDFYEKAIALGLHGAKLDLASLYHFGLGTTRDYGMSLPLMLELDSWIGEAYQFGGTGLDVDLMLAEKFHLKAIEAGYIAPLINLGNLESGLGNFIAGNEYFERAFLELSSEGNYDLGLQISTLNGLTYNLMSIGDFGKSVNLGLNQLKLLDDKLEQDENPNKSYWLTKKGEALTNLGYSYFQLDSFDLAEEALSEALILIEKNYGTETYEFASALSSLSDVYFGTARTNLGIDTIKNAIGIVTRCCAHIDADVIARYQTSLAYEYIKIGEHDKAETLLVSANKLLKEQYTNFGQYNRIWTLEQMTSLYLKKLEFGKAKEIAEEALFILKNQVENLNKLNLSSGSSIHALYANVLFELDSSTLANNAFQAVQDNSDFALSKLINENSILGRSVIKSDINYFRKKREIMAKIVVVDGKFEQLRGETKSDFQKVEKVVTQKRKLKIELSELKSNFAKNNPDYALIFNASPLSFIEVSTSLIDKEALFLTQFSDSLNYGLAFMITKDDARAYKIDLSESDIADIVGELRADIDLSNSFGFGDLPNFDMDLSYDLYSKLFGPVEDMLEGVKHLLVVPTGPLESLPLNLLVTEKPDIDPTASVFENYQAAAWLPKTYSLTRLPSVSSLRALRVFASEGQSQDPFIGFGDPVLDGPAGDLRGLTIEDVYQGGEANIAAVRNLPELPETSEELKRIAAYLGAPEDRVYLRERASEAVLKNTNLTNSRVVAFATHGLVGGEISGLAEPALVLSPPSEATNEDDGLLKASEVAQLKMNADMVLLSACNTASGDELGAEGLSGLARAFIYAGARSLLVSHWSVESTSAAELTTGMFDAINQDQELGRSEALQRSMIELMTNEDRPYYSHPAFWAPFSLIGDGQTAQLN